MEVNAWICTRATDRDLDSVQSRSISVRTRKMVNHAGTCLWRLVATGASCCFTRCNLSVESLVAHAAFSKAWIQCNSP